MMQFMNIEDNRSEQITKFLTLSTTSSSGDPKRGSTVSILETANTTSSFRVSEGGCSFFDDPFFDEFEEDLFVFLLGFFDDILRC